MTKTGFKRIVLVNYTQVFDEPLPVIEVLLKKVDFLSLVNVSTHFLRYNNNQHMIENLEEFITGFFSQKNHLFANQVYNKLKIIKNDYDERISIINNINMLRLFDCAIQQRVEVSQKDILQNERNVFKLILILNEIYAKGYDSNDSSDLTLEWLNVLAYFPQVDYENLNYRKIFGCQVIKSIYLFEFLDTNDSTSPIINDYLEYLGFNSWRDYLLKLFNLVQPCVNPEYKGFINIKRSFFNVLKKEGDLIADLVLDSNYSDTEPDFINVRSTPLLLVDEEHYRVVYDLFVIELMFKAQFFKLNGFIKKNDNYTIKARDFRSYYCDHFSEKALFYSVVERSFPQQKIKCTGELLKLKGIQSEPDYYFRNGNKIFIFENKDTLITKEAKWSFNKVKLENEIRKKLYFDGNSNKAVKQLVNTIVNIFSGGFEAADRINKPKNLRFFPVIVLHDNLADVPSLNYIINEWFFEELSGKQLEDLVIHPITIISIDYFIYYSDLLRTKKLNFELSLMNYFKLSKDDPTKTYRDIHHKNEVFEKRFIPFGQFMEYEYLKDVKLSTSSLFKEKIRSIVKD